jgi:hypothetical protein
MLVSGVDALRRTDRESFEDWTKHYEKASKLAFALSELTFLVIYPIIITCGRIITCFLTGKKEEVMLFGSI